MSKQNGFTLIETLLVIFLIGIVGSIVVDLFIGQNRIYKVQTAELNITSGARAALDDIDAYVRLANRVLDSYSTYTSGPQTMVLQIQSINASDRLIPATFDNVVYYLDSGNLYREVFPNALSTRPAGIKNLTGNVSSLTFTYNNASFPQVDEVSTVMVIEEDAGVQTRTINISTKSALRNY